MPHIKRNPDGTANWKPEYDRLFDYTVGLERRNSAVEQALTGLVTYLLRVRRWARKRENWKLSDTIRRALKDSQIIVEDRKGGEQGWRVRLASFGDKV